MDQQLLHLTNPLKLVHPMRSMLTGIHINSRVLLIFVLVHLVYKTRIDNHGVLHITGQANVYGTSPSTSRYLNFDNEDFRLYLGMVNY